MQKKKKMFKKVPRKKPLNYFQIQQLHLSHDLCKNKRKHNKNLEKTKKQKNKRKKNWLKEIPLF